MNRWKRVAEGLARLAEDQRGTPEGEAAGRKLRAILAKYPQARDYEPVRQFTMADLRYILRHADVSTEGRWDGQSPDDALRKAFAELGLRVDAHREATVTRKEIDGS